MHSSPQEYRSIMDTCTPCLRVLQSADLLHLILHSNPFPRNTAFLFSPRRVIRQGSLILNPSSLIEYKVWISQVATLRAVNRQLCNALAPMLFQSLWIDHPYQMRLLVELFASQGWNRRIDDNWVCHLRLDIPWDHSDSLENHDDSSLDTRITGWQSWPVRAPVDDTALMIDVCLLPMTYPSSD